MTALLTFEYTSVYGALAAAYTSGALAAEFGPEHVRVALRTDAGDRSYSEQSHRNRAYSNRANGDRAYGDSAYGDSAYSDRAHGEPLIVEAGLTEAVRDRFGTRLLGIVPDGDGPAWALTTSQVNLERQGAMLVRALSAVLQARPHRKPEVDASIALEYPQWIADCPLRAANILVMEHFSDGGVPLAA